MTGPFRATQLAQSLVRDRLRPGDVAIDATAGNGHDTAFLARLVGKTGRVYAFDIQPGAIDATRSRLQEEGLCSQTVLLEAGHECLHSHLPSSAAGNVQAVMFNLGYLPGSDRTLVTRPSTTLAALENALPLLAPGGLITLVCYCAHPGGAEEASAVSAYCERLDPSRFRALRCQVLNCDRPPPFVIAIESRTAGPTG